jgi:methylated-DNA-[protein]-cysteine S-methyltransferase
MDASKRFFYHSPIGWIRIIAEDGAVTGLDFVERRAADSPSPSACLPAAQAQVEEYFLGRRTAFDLPLSLRGTPFQEDVWKALLRIPFGETASYKDVAAEVGRPDAVRAVGAANGANPVSLIVPCHRVLGADGRLTGYGGGLWRKEFGSMGFREIGIYLDFLPSPGN